MRIAGLKRAAAASLLLALPAIAEARQPDSRQIGNASLEPIALESLPGFTADDHVRALKAFRLSCATRDQADPQPDSVAGTKAELARACEAAARVPDGEASSFFTTRFDAYRVRRPPDSKGRRGLLTGYFEPELPGSLSPGPNFAAPALSRPADLVSFHQGETRPGLDPSLRAARKTAHGFEPYPDRAAIEDGALNALVKPLLWLDPVDLVMLQIQGSGRIRLPDGSRRRLLYDGKNGRPFTGIPSLIVKEGHLPLAGLTLDKWMSWLRANPHHAKALIRRNASYVFFKLEPASEGDHGPLGSSKAALTPGRSIAVDGGLWRYGLPFWLEGRLPEAGGAAADSTGRLVIAQDSGSAILGPARGDYYVGTGKQAGEIADRIHDSIGFVVLLPKPLATSTR